MRFFFAFSVLASVAISINAASTQGVCNPVQSCTSSVDCAIAGDSLSCRCSYFNCKDYGTETCGGSCVTDAQCAQWSGGEASCVCNWWFECERESLSKEPGYETYAKMMAAIKKDKLAKRLATLTNEFKDQEEEISKRLME